MKKHLLFTLFMALGFTISITAQENLFDDYQMDDGSIWTMANYGTEDFGVYTTDYSGMLSGEASVSVEIVGEGNSWDVQFYQPGKTIEDGVTYYLSFMALAEEDFIVEFSAELGGDPYTRYFTQTFTVVPGTKEYFAEFLAVVPDPFIDENTSLKFLLSNSANVNKTVYLDSMVLSTERWLYGEPVAVEDKMAEEMSFNVYPNPAVDNFEISAKFTEAQNLNISVYNILGQKQLTLLNEKLTSGEFRQQFSTEKLPSGIYNVRISTDRQDINKLLVIE